jgi:hypothetical protein
MTDELTIDATAEPDSDLEDYRRYVIDIAKAADGKVILNRSPSHAAVVIEQIFNGATQEVVILTEDLCMPIYGVHRVIQSAIHFLRDRPGAVLRILSERQLDRTHPLLGALDKNGLLGRVELRILSEKMKQSNQFHFAVADSRCFLFEPSKDVTGAIVQFGDDKVGAKLRSVFSGLQDSSAGRNERYQVPGSGG